MKQRLLFFFAFLLTTGIASAQVDLKRGPVLLNPMNVISPKGQFETAKCNKAPRRSLEVGYNQMWWGLYQGNEKLEGVGVTNPADYMAAMHIASSNSIAVGKEVKAVRFAVSATETMENLKVWLSTNLPDQVSNANVAVLDIPMAGVKDGELVEVELEEPYQITSKGLYVGFSFRINTNKEAYPILVTYYNKGEDGGWLKTSASQLSSWTDISPNYGNLPIQVLLEGDFPHNAVSVGSTFLDVLSLPNGTADATLSLTNDGIDNITSIGYTVTDEQGTSEEQEVTVTPFSGLHSTGTAIIPLIADAQSGRTPRTVTITKVNGEPNTTKGAAAVSQGYMVTLSQTAKKRTVVEEFTGTWCQWCPRGIVGLDLLNEKMKDEVITIAVHNKDPMEVEYGVSASSYPYAMVNRNTPADPYWGTNGNPFGIGDLVAEQNRTLAEASVSLAAPVLDKSGRITFSTDVTFYYSSDKSNYALGYVLLSDGLTGTSPDWWQANGYSGLEAYKEDPNLKEWVDAAQYVNLTYNHVAVASKSMEHGATGSIKAPIEDGVTKTVSNNFSIAGNSLLQDFEHLSVVAVLFNTQTGAIVNADIQAVTIDDSFAVNSARISGFSRTTILLGETGQVSVPVSNYGRAGIKSIDYAVRAGVKEGEVQHLELEKPIMTYGVGTSVNFAVPADTVTGIVNRSIVLKAINGEENESATGKSASGSIMTIAKKSPRKTVVEEFTGTWCMFCPRGMAGLKRLGEEYADDAVFYAIHSGGSSGSDPMQVSAFSSLLSTVAGFPSAFVNRYISTDPYFGNSSEGFGLGRIVSNEQSKLVEASIDLSTPVLDEETGIVSFSTDVTFQISRRSAPYLLAYVLVADGLSGTSNDWTQVNFYSYYAGAYDDDPYMKEVTEWPLYVTGLVYDHVGISATGISSGIAGSLKNRVEEGETQSHSSQFNIKNLALAKKASKLHVIALLYDKTDKTIINADQKEVVVSSSVGTLSNKDGERHEVARYSADGKRVSHPVKGLNIVRMNDGSVKKVMVK